MDWTALGQLIRQAAEQVVAAGDNGDDPPAIRRRLRTQAVGALTKHEPKTVSALIGEGSDRAVARCEGGRWLSTGGLQVNQYRQQLIANNIANSETAGFKHDLAVIHERPMESRTAADGASFGHELLDRLSGGTWVRPTYHSFQQGPLEPTGRGLDAAIQGDGFFTIRDAQGTRYTRDGRFVMNAAGELARAAGDGNAKVLDDAGQPIVIDPKGEEVVIDGNGTVRQGRTVVARLGLAEFADRNVLRKIGNNLFEAGGARPLTAGNTVVQGGFVEGSTQDPLKGLVEMIEVTRAHEMNARMITLQDQTIGQAANTVGRAA
jgi:flagellar basal body rod protein FlgG